MTPAERALVSTNAERRVAAAIAAGEDVRNPSVQRRIASESGASVEMVRDIVGRGK